MPSPLTVAVTGAWTYSGRFVAARLLAAGCRVISLTGRSVPDPDPFGGRVRAFPYSRDPSVLQKALKGVDVLASAYWVRHDRAPLGHRGPWTSHLQAVGLSAALIDAAVAAGVSRLVWTSIANPGLDPDLSYYSGKALVERLVRASGLPFAILRPACFFGPRGLLLENVAWAVKRFPVFPIPLGPDGALYFVRPIHVADYAGAVVDAVKADGVSVRDAAGPDRVEFGSLVQDAAAATWSRVRVLRLPVSVCAGLYSAASFALSETILTRDELVGLSRNRLDSLEAPLGRTSLRGWLFDQGVNLGRRLCREPSR